MSVSSWAAPPRSALNPRSVELFRIDPVTDYSKAPTGAGEKAIAANKLVFVIFGVPGLDGGIGDIHVQSYNKDGAGLTPYLEEKKPVVFASTPVRDKSTGRQYRIIKLYNKDDAPLKLELEVELGAFNSEAEKQNFDLRLKSFPWAVSSPEGEVVRQGEHDIKLDWEIRKNEEAFETWGTLKPTKGEQQGGPCCRPGIDTDCVQCEELSNVEAKIKTITPDFKLIKTGWFSGEARGQQIKIEGESQDNEGNTIPIIEESTAYRVAETTGDCQVAWKYPDFPVVDHSFPIIPAFLDDISLLFPLI